MKATHIGYCLTVGYFFLGGIFQSVMPSNVSPGSASNYGIEIEGHRRNDQLYGTLDRLIGRSKSFTNNLDLNLIISTIPSGKLT